MHYLHTMIRVKDLDSALDFFASSLQEDASSPSSSMTEAPPSFSSRRR